MTFAELMGDYIPDELEEELCPKCCSKLRVTKFNDDAWGYPRNFKEKVCSNDDCLWESVEPC